MEWKTGFRVLMASEFHFFLSDSVMTSQHHTSLFIPSILFFFLLNKGEEKEHCYNLVPYPHPGVKNLKKLIYSSLQIKTGNFLMYIQALTNIQICICRLPGLQFIYCALQTNQVP